MMNFTIALLSSAISLTYYIALYFHSALKDNLGGVFLGLVAFICLHVALRRVIGIHSQHVGLLMLTASLIILYHWFNDGSVFLALLVLIHITLVVTVILSIDFKIDKYDSPDDDGRLQ